MNDKLILYLLGGAAVYLFISQQNYHPASFTVNNSESDQQIQKAPGHIISAHENHSQAFGCSCRQ